MSLPGLPDSGRVYEQWFEVSSEEFGLSPYLLAAICERESHFGHALRPPTHQGTGDWAPRERHRVRHDCPVKAAQTPGLVTPLDGLGWGRGLMQLDWASHPELWRSDIWRDASWNIHGAAAHFYNLMHEFGHDEFVALCAYNAGAGRIQRALPTCEHLPTEQRNHILESYTTGRDYAADCLRRRDLFVSNEAKQGEA